MRYDGQNGHNVDVKRRGAKLALPAVSMSSKKLTWMLRIQTTSTRESRGPLSFTVINATDHSTDTNPSEIMYDHPKTRTTVANHLTSRPRGGHRGGPCNCFCKLLTADLQAPAITPTVQILHSPRMLKLEVMVDRQVPQAQSSCALDQVLSTPMLKICRLVV